MDLTHVPIWRVSEERLLLDGRFDASAVGLSEDDPKFSGSIKATGYIYKAGDVAILNLDLNATRDISCSRCLSHFKNPYTTDLSLDLNLSELGRYLNLYPLIREELIINDPLNAVCREDCKGLCMRCGCDLNAQTCACQSQTAPLKKMKAL